MPLTSNKVPNSPSVVIGSQWRTGKVGSKGKLFPRKNIRDTLSMALGPTVSFSMDRGRLVVQPLPSLEELLSKEQRRSFHLRISLGPVGS